MTLERLSGPKKGADWHFLNLREYLYFFHFTRLNSEINFLVFKVILTIKNKAKYTSILILNNFYKTFFLCQILFIN